MVEDAIIVELGDRNGRDTLEEARAEMAARDMELSPPIVAEDNLLQPMRQSERLKAQGLNTKLAMDKAVALKKKKNLEGKGLNTKKSFAILDDSILLNKAMIMGININTLTMDNIDILRDLELARFNLLARNEESTNDSINITQSAEILPFEEAKFIEWHSDDSDNEEFTEVISSRMKKKLAQMKRKKSVAIPRESPPHPLDGEGHPEGDVPKICSRYNLRKCKPIKIRKK